MAKNQLTSQQELVAELYRTEKVTFNQAQKLLGHATWQETSKVLKKFGCELFYDQDDYEEDLDTLKEFNNEERGNVRDEKQILLDRLEKYRANPDSAIEWENLQQEVTQKYGGLHEKDVGKITNSQEEKTLPWQEKMKSKGKILVPEKELMKPIEDIWEDYL